MLLDNLVEASIVDLDELGEVVDIGNNIAQVLLQQHELLLAGTRLTQAALVKAAYNIFDLTLADLDSPLDLNGLDLLLLVDLFELGLELAHEAALIVFGPFSLGLGTLALAFLFGMDLYGLVVRRLNDGTAGILEVVLEAVIVNVVPLVLADDAGPKLLAELHDDGSRLGSPDGIGKVLGMADGLPGALTSLEVLNDQHGGSI